MSANPDKLRFLLTQQAAIFSHGLWFTDGEGVRWIRDPSGSLAEADLRLPRLDARVLRGLHALSDDGERAAEVDAIAHQARISRRIASRQLEVLRERGLVRVHVSKPGETWWRLTAAGRVNAKSPEGDGSKTEV